jgi:hypothetical protein
MAFLLRERSQADPGFLKKVKNPLSSLKKVLKWGAVSDFGLAEKRISPTVGAIVGIATKPSHPHCSTYKTSPL